MAIVDRAFERAIIVDAISTDQSAEMTCDFQMSKIISIHLGMGVFGNSSPRLRNSPEKLQLVAILQEKQQSPQGVVNSDIEMTTQTVLAFPKNTRKL